MNTIHATTAMILLSHGSRATAAQHDFASITEDVRARLRGLRVELAYMELAEPTLATTAAKLVQEGTRKLVIMPYFLFSGNHIQHDIPSMIKDLEQEFPNTEFVLTPPLGRDGRIAEVAIDRALPFLPKKQLLPNEIEPESMRIVDSLLPAAANRWNAPERTIAKRLVHASGDPSLAEVIHFTPNAVACGLTALAQGAPIITDVQMVKSGIRADLASKCRAQIICALDQINEADGTPNNPPNNKTSELGKTRTANGIRSLGVNLNGAVVAIGNAPTALREIMALVQEGVAKPALIIGMPVGFVDAAESKATLIGTNLEAITIQGTRGGSPLAAATVNALLLLNDNAL